MKELQTSRPDHDNGAAAVEFSLLMPIFVILSVGSISAGIIFWHAISAAQAVRDAGRYAATLPLSTMTPLPVNTYSFDTWSTATLSVALREAGVGDTRGPDGSPTPDIPDGKIDGWDARKVDTQVCIAFVKGSTSTHTLGTASRTYGGGTGASGGGSLASTPCIASDGAPDVDRVQVVFKRDETFNAIFYYKDVTPESRSVQPYQRVIP